MKTVACLPANTYSQSLSLILLVKIPVWELQDCSMVRSKVIIDDQDQMHFKSPLLVCIQILFPYFV